MSTIKALKVGLQYLSADSNQSFGGGGGNQYGMGNMMGGSMGGSMGGGGLMGDAPTMDVSMMRDRNRGGGMNRRGGMGMGGGMMG